MGTMTELEYFTLPDHLLICDWCGTEVSSGQNHPVTLAELIQYAEEHQHV